MTDSTDLGRGGVPLLGPPRGEGPRVPSPYGTRSGAPAAQQRSVFQDAIDAGKVLPPAKNMDDMHTVVTNSTVDGVLSAVLAVLIVIVIADALRVCVRHVRRPALSTLREAPYVESRIVAPAGLIPTREEKEEARDAVGAGSGG